MGCRKWAQLVMVVIMAITLVACSAPKSSIAPTTLPQTLTPTQVLTVIPSPAPTSVKVSSFEECIASGVLIQNTFPRECISNNGKVFREGVVFSKIYGTTASQSGRFITSTMDGGHLIAGGEKGCWILKLDASSEVEWEASLSEELAQELQLEGATFWCWLARQTPDGDYVGMGTGYDADFGQFRKTFMVTLTHRGNLVSGQLIAERGAKTPFLDQNGNLIWLTSFGIPREVRETLDGGYIIVGHFEQSSPDSGMHMIKTDKNGAYVWDKNLCLDKNIHQVWEEKIVCSYNYVRDVIQLQDGSFVITGVDNGTWLLKADTNGNIDWIQSYEHKGFSLIQMPDGGFLIAGEQLVDQKQTDGMLIKTDSVGNLQWSRNLGGDKDDGFVSIEQKPNGEIVIMGWSKSFGAGETYLWLLGIDGKILE